MAILQWRTAFGESSAGYDRLPASCTAPVRRSPLAGGLNDGADARVNFRRPAPAAEDAIMPDPGLQMVVLAKWVQPGTQLLRRQGLTDGADVVVLAFDREERGAPDRRRPDLAAA